ncbi:MAG: hypothetical protein GX624_09980 [Actinobacteria bacterium]|nr:hypothetical protein [Actinomycetota bacterium]
MICYTCQADAGASQSERTPARMEASGVLEALAERLQMVAGDHPILLGVGLIWAVALLSAVIDSIPITVALIPVVGGLASFGIETEPLWWTLAFGAGLGGNSTIIGSSANIIVTSHSERSALPISSAGWMRVGVPMLLVTCTVASVLYAALYSLVILR